MLLSFSPFSSSSSSSSSSLWSSISSSTSYSDTSNHSTMGKVVVAEEDEFMDEIIRKSDNQNRPMNKGHNSSNTSNTSPAKSIFSSSYSQPLSYNQQQSQLVQPFPRTWVPLGSVFELNPDRPTPVQFMGLSYVVYQASPTRWVVCDDACPHRLAPLSEGRIERFQSTQTTQTTQTTQPTQPMDKSDDTQQSEALLQCSYHGWSFDSSGRCVSIPQVDPATEQRVTKMKSRNEDNTSTGSSSPVGPLPFSTSCHVRTYSVQLVKNIVWAWLWPEDIMEFYFPNTTDTLDSKQYIDSTLTTSTISTTSTTPTAQQLRQHTKYPTQVDKMVGDPSYMLTNILDDCSTYTRELPYGWDTLLENFLDPSHVPFAHHGLQGNRNDAIPINMSNPIMTSARAPLDTNTTASFATGFSFTFNDRTMAMTRSGEAVFRAPYVIQYGAMFENNKSFNLSAVIIPTKPGWSKIILFGFPTKKTPVSSTTPTTPTSPAAGTASNSGKNIRQQQHQEQQTNLTATATDDDTNFYKSLQRTLLSAFPIWVVHQFNNRFLDSDLALLHYQEQEISRRRKLYIKSNDDRGISRSRSISSTSFYFMPGQSDRCVSALRKWVETYASYVTDEQKLPPPIYDRNLLFDRYHQHTEHCQHCNAAYESIPKWRQASYTTLASTLASSYIVATSLPTITAITGIPSAVFAFVGAIVIVSCFVTLRVLDIAEESLTKGEFKHYKNH